MASIIKADNIQKVSDGTNIIKKCGSTTTIGSGACSPIVICGSTVTLGRCGGTVTLASGATQTGFGQTYSAVEYCTTAKTSPFTAVSGKGYFVNTTCAAVTVTLPASPTAGDVISLADYASNWCGNNVTLCNNSSKINGICGITKLSTKGQSVTLIYADATRGWKTVQDSTADVTASVYITATGGTITTCGDYKIHTFTADGTFCVSAANVPANNYVDYVVVGGGGAGGLTRGGGGGAGGYRESYNPCTSGTYSASPLATPTSLPVSVQAYPVTVGAGAPDAGDQVPPAPAASAGGFSGSNSVFSTITSTGGGGGGGYAYNPTNWTGRNGGSGGGGGSSNGSCTATVAGSGNTPPVAPPQGNPGGINPNLDYGAGGGGGASAAGGNAPGTSTPGQVAGVGGAGVSSSITGSSVTRAGGGGGGGYTQWNSGGAGGGGDGGTQSPLKASTAGTVNTGGGGGGKGCNGAGGSPAGGSGIVIIRYKYQ